jgi:uncharacterized surface protein with fasciclin (FAS1) repeats
MASMNSRTSLLWLVVALAALAGCNVTESPEPAIESTAPPAAHVTHDLVGPGCDAYIRDHATGAGSATAIARQSAAVAIEDHPELTEFAKAISGGLNPNVHLADQLDAGKFTIFAPTDSAFAKLPSQSLRTLAEPQSAAALTDLLMSHVVKGEQNPHTVGGTLETLDGETIKVTSAGDRIRVDGQANVVCGGLHAANATLYLIDTVLMPPVRTKE